MTLCMTFYVFFHVFVYFISAVLLFTVHLCAIDTRFNKCNLLTYLLTVTQLVATCNCRHKDEGRRGDTEWFFFKISRNSSLYTRWFPAKFGCNPSRIAGDTGEK